MNNRTGSVSARLGGSHRPWDGRRSGLTLIELLVAVVVSVLLVFAGLSLVTSLLYGSGEVFSRVVGQTEPQEIVDVLDPALSRAGASLPVDSGFGGLSVSATGDTVFALFPRQDSLGGTMPPFPGMSCPPDPISPGCALVFTSSSLMTAAEPMDQFIVITSPNGISRLAALASPATDVGGNMVRLVWTPANNAVGYPAPSETPGQPDMQVQRVSLTMVIYDRSGSRLLVSDPESRKETGLASTWLLADNITSFEARPVYDGRPSTAAAGSLRPATGINPSYLNMTGVQLTYTQRFWVIDEWVEQSRVVVISPMGLAR